MKYLVLSCAGLMLVSCTSDPLDAAARQALGPFASSDAEFQNLKASSNPDNPREGVICGEVKDRQDVAYVPFFAWSPPAGHPLIARDVESGLLLALAAPLCQGRWKQPVRQGGSEGTSSAGALSENGEVQNMTIHEPSPAPAQTAEQLAPEAQSSATLTELREQRRLQAENTRLERAAEQALHRKPEPRDPQQQADIDMLDRMAGRR